MTKYARPLCALSAAVLFLFAQGTSLSVQAQDSNAAQPKAGAAQSKFTTQAFSAWTLVCAADDKTACIMQQQLVDPKSKRPLATATVQITKERGAELLVQSPPGVFIEPGMALKIDDKDAAKAPFTACASRACEAVFKIDQDLINGLAGGKELGIVIQSVSGKPVTIGLQLTGFSEAYAALKNNVAN